MLNRLPWHLQRLLFLIDHFHFGKWFAEQHKCGGHFDIKSYTDFLKAQASLSESMNAQIGGLKHCMQRMGLEVRRPSRSVCDGDSHCDNVMVALVALVAGVCANAEAVFDRVRAGQEFGYAGPWRRLHSRAQGTVGCHGGCG